ncbi:hypothetical protein GHT06_013626 [Daphnia sinensis]|uniref:Uncharacterized protein n=1 Tax=Daphnia sinensis TaxID=1820382 RepID=A0AAD5PTQ0_9CRUS|nr:hypothetical protein GHT06_013626 [Daphnia sinensis]
MMWRYTVLEMVGLLSLLVFWGLILKELWIILYTCYLGHVLGHNIKPRKLGKWAVITGATDGIGRAYAEELASNGLNIVLISRSRDKLQAVASAIECRYHVETRIIDVDFTQGAEIYERIAKDISGLEIGILINNVGMSYKYPEYLDQIPDASGFAQRVVNCNVVSVTQMSIMVLGQMAERKKGFILNVASCSAVVPTPLMSLYSSTKAFVYKFSEDLALEYKPFGIRVQCVLPCFVATKMSGIKNSNIMAPSPADFARGNMNSWGLEVSSAGYWFHKLQWIYYRRLNQISPSSMANVTYNIMMGLRKRAFDKRAQQKKATAPTAVVNPPVAPVDRHSLARTDRDLNDMWPSLSQIPRYGITLHAQTGF